jgi:hypothetical protein
MIQQLSTVIEKGVDEAEFVPLLSFGLVSALCSLLFLLVILVICMCIAACAGSVHTCLLTALGHVYTCGKCEYTGHGDGGTCLFVRQFVRVFVLVVQTIPCTYIHTYTVLT